MLFLRKGFMPVMFALLLMLPLVSSFTAASDGGVSLSQTRVVFLSTDNAQTITISNDSKRSYLIQSRVQAQDHQPSLGSFIVTPPLFKLQPNGRQLLRILPQNMALPADRESLFYFSALAIPAQTDGETKDAQISMGFRFVTKLFYRPEGLATRPEDAVCRLQFSLTPTGVRVWNPTPYFQTLGQLALDGHPVNFKKQSSMISPMSEQRYPSSGVIGRAEWQTITDYGGLSIPCQQNVLPEQERS